MVVLEMDRNARNAIVLQPEALPVMSGTAARSFFGGLPKLPPQMAWPAKVVDGRYRYPAFVAQIDLEELPHAHDSPLPRAGTLYFFANFTKEWMEDDDAIVLYHDGSAVAYEERQPPLLIRDGALPPWTWLEGGEVSPHPHYKYPVRFFPFRSHRMWLADPRGQATDPGTDARALRMQRLSLESVLGPRKVLENVWNFELHDDEWPFAWAVIEHSVRALSAAIEKACDDAQDSFAATERFQPMLEQTEEWLSNAQEQDALAAPDASIREAFRAQWVEWRENIEQISRELRIGTIYPDRLMREVVRLAHFLKAPAPEKYRRAIDEDRGWHWRHPPYHGEDDPPLLNQMLGHGQVVQHAAIDYVDEVLLLQIQGDMHLQFWPLADSYGVVQFWISPQDLAARRFEKVFVTFECT